MSTMTHALTEQEVAFGGFAYSVICAHPSNLSYCVNIEEQDAAEKACQLWQLNLNPTYSYSFISIIAGTPDRCLYEGRNPSNGLKASITQALHKKSGLCPAKDQPPPTQVIFSRQGRWFPQELGGERCFRSCSYENVNSFDYKHYSFTNGIVTEFLENSNRLKSRQEFCEMEPEPARNSDDEVTYESSCEDAVFQQICDFINWFRNDSEMPQAPDVQQNTVSIDQHLKTDWVDAGLDANTSCFEPIEFNMFLSWSRDEVKQEINFTAMCNKIYAFGNFFRALYLLAACFIVFRN